MPAAQQWRWCKGLSVSWGCSSRLGRTSFPPQTACREPQVSQGASQYRYEIVSSGLSPSCAGLEEGDERFLLGAGRAVRRQRAIEVCLQDGRMDVALTAYRLGVAKQLRHRLDRQGDVAAGLRLRGAAAPQA